MKILIVSQYFWPESFRINDLALGLQQRGHDIEVVTGMPNYPGGEFYPGYGSFAPAWESFESIPIVRVPLLSRGTHKNWRLALNYASFALTASILGPLRCRKKKYDLVFVYEPSPITVAIPGIVFKIIKRVPMFLWVQDLWPESLAATGAVNSPFVLRAVRRLVHSIYRRCDRVLVSSKGFTAHVLASGIENGQVAYLPNWAESLYRPLATAPASVQSELPTGFNVMFAGNIGSAQSFETIIGAAERLKDHRAIHWVILGDGNMKTWVAEQTRRRGLERQFHLLGSRPTDTMPGYFAAAGALLVTLRADPVFALTVPSKIQSYLACGKPVIAALNGEGASIVTESAAGISCRAEDPDKLAAAVLTLYEMSETQRVTMGENARAYFELNFERGMLLDRLERWMLETAGKKSCAF